jgi:hypothetical protein
MKDHGRITMPRKKKAENGGVATRSLGAATRPVMGYMATRQFKLRTGQTVFNGEILPEGFLSAATVRAFLESGEVTRVYEDGSTDIPASGSDAGSATPTTPMTVERMMLQPDTAVLRQLLAEPPDVDRCGAAQLIAAGQARHVLAYALALAERYYHARTYAPADRL